MSSKIKRNITNTFLTITLVAFLLLTLYLGFIVIKGKLESKKTYQDPEISSTLIRGNITDRNGNLLSIQTTQYALYFKLKETEDIYKNAVIVSPYLHMSAEEIVKRCENYTTTALIKRRIKEEDALKLKEVIKENGLENEITLEKYEGRTYPATFHAAQIIGFTNTSNIGAEGIEAAYNEELQPYPELDKKISYGNEVKLTLDLDIQYLVDVQVQNIAYEHDPDYIMAMVMDASTGEILASSSYPWYDLNAYNTSTDDERMNRVFSYTYEPGSVFKILSLAAAMENGVDTTTPFLCDGEERFTVDGQSFLITCHEKHGEVDGKGMIEKSCNGAIASWAIQIDKQVFYDFLKTLNFGTRYDIGLGGVAKGTLREVKDWSNRSEATLSFGQELSVNALQVVSASTIIANDGKLLYPSLVKEIRSPEGEILYTNEKIEKSVISEETADEILTYMQSAVEKGTASKAKVEGVKVAAKTGTAEIINPESGSYIDGTSLASTIAMVPADNPDYIIYFAVSAPKGDSIWGANVASPSCGEVIKGLIAQGKIKTDNQNVLQLN